MSRLTIPETHLRPPVEPAEPVKPEEPKISLTRAELEKLLTEAEESGFKRGELRGEEKARGVERAELEEQLQAVSGQESRLETAFRDIASVLQELDAKVEVHNKTLESNLEAAACAMASCLLIEVNESEALIKDLLTSLRERHRVSSMTVFVPEPLAAPLRDKLEDQDDVRVRTANTGDALSVHMETETGELRYSTQDVAADLHKRLLECSDASD